MTKICAAAMIVRDSKILLGKRAPGQLLYPDVWDLPGGHLEIGETPDQALIRELEEELGIVPTHFEFLGMFDELNPEKYGAHQYHVYVVLSGAAPSRTTSRTSIPKSDGYPSRQRINSSSPILGIWNCFDASVISEPPKARRIAGYGATRRLSTVWR